MRRASLMNGCVQSNLVYQTYWRLKETKEKLYKQSVAKRFAHYYRLSCVLPVDDCLFKLLVAGFSVTPDSIERCVPEMVGHQRQVSGFIPESGSRSMSECVNPFELDLSDPAGGLEPFVHGNAGAGRQEVATAFF